MANNFDLDNLKEKYLRKKFSWGKVWKEIWPIDWSILKKPKLIATAISKSTYGVKAFFVFSLLGLMVSFGFLTTKVYLATTTPVATEGGTFREAVVGGKMMFFNPVLDNNNNEAERKINRLLYHPLYEVIYPDFGKSDIQDPTIKPILLTKEPEWMDLENSSPSNRYKSLKFTLRKDIKWSNGEDITIDDIKYTFNRLRENRGNAKYKDLFQDISFIKVSKNEFKLVSKISNPQLIYLVDFAPISADYYSSQNIQHLWFSKKSIKPTVTSGYFRFPEGDVQDPYSQKDKKVENPILEEDSDDYRAVVLEKNPIQNTGEKIYIDKYVIKRYDTVTEEGGSDSVNLERDARDGKIDLYTRFLGTNMNLSPSALKKVTGLNQKITNSNTFYTAFYNIKQGSTGYLVNKTMRNYISCYLIDYKPEKFSSYLDPIDKDKRIVPIQFNESFNPDCSNKESILDPQYYSFEKDERNSIKTVLLSGEEITGFTIVGYQDSSKLLQDIQIYFRDTIGIPVTVVTEEAAVQAALENKTYNIAILPVTLVNQDPYSLFGAKGYDLSQISYNSRVDSYNVEDNLATYSSSDLKNEDARENLINFFSNEFVTMNLFRAKNEYNYSNRVFESGDSVLNYSLDITKMHLNIPEWYIETKRKFGS